MKMKRVQQIIMIVIKKIVNQKLLYLKEMVGKKVI